MQVEGESGEMDSPLHPFQGGVMKMKKEDFNAGSPYSSWLKEELVGEVMGHLHGMENRGLVKKYKVYVDDGTEQEIMNIRKFDDLSDGLKKIATDIIRMELDSNFKGVM